MDTIRFWLIAFVAGVLAVTPAGGQTPAGSELDTAALVARAEAGDPNAQNLLGALYQTGSGVGRELAEAEHWYAKAAEQGHPAAQANLGALYLEGKVDEPVRGRGAELVRMAAARGDPMGIARLGALHLRGDVEQGTRLLMQAVDLHVGLAAFELGRAHLYGIGLRQDAEQAKAWFIRSSDMGYPPGQYVHARKYETDPDRVFALFQRAAAGGHAGAQYELGRRYESRTLPAYDLDKAVYWYTKAAMNGNEMGNQARFRLGLPDINGNPPLNKTVLTTHPDETYLDDHTTVVALAAAAGIAIILLTAGESEPGRGSDFPKKPYCYPCDYGETEYPDDQCLNLSTGGKRSRICY